jgi:hypothetical protein
MTRDQRAIEFQLVAEFHYAASRFSRDFTASRPGLARLDRERELLAAVHDQLAAAIWSKSARFVMFQEEV